jgi:hypothetical protein
MPYPTKTCCGQAADVHVSHKGSIMTKDENNIPEPMKALAHDLGLNPDGLTHLDLDSIFKKGTNPILFLTRVGHVYTQSHHLEGENERLKAQLDNVDRQLADAKAQVVALQKGEIVLQKENEFLSTTGQNSVPGAILFSLGSIIVGVCGGYINAQKYLYAAIAGLIGIGLSAFAASLIIRRSKKEVGDA